MRSSSSPLCSGVVMETSSTLSNWCWRIMPRVSLPAAPGSARKHGVPARERALEPRERALEHHEARAGQLCRGLEVHLPQSFTEIEMLLRRESVIALGAETMVLDVIGCLLAVRHVLERQVGDLRQRVVELLRELLLFCLERRDFGFQTCDLGKERLRRRLLVALLRRADLTRSDIAARERRLRFLNGSAPALIDGKEL